MTDLQYDLLLPCQRDHGIGFRERRRQRLFHQQVQATLHQLLGHLKVAFGWGCDHGRIDLSKQVATVAERLGAGVCRHRGACRRVRINDSD